MIDSGATHSFIHQNIVRELNLPMMEGSKFGVTIGDENSHLRDRNSHLRTRHMQKGGAGVDRSDYKGKLLGYQFGTIGCNFGHPLLVLERVYEYTLTIKVDRIYDGRENDHTPWGLVTSHS